MEKYGVTFQEMHTKEKIKHIWGYYRWHILSAMIGLVVVFFLGKALFFPEPPNDVDIVIAANMHLSMEDEEVIRQFKEEFNTGLDLSNILWADPQSSVIMLQKIPLMITTGEMDIFGATSETYENFMQVYGEDMFIPLEKLPALSDLLDKYSDQLVSCDYIRDEEGNKVDTQTHIYGIRVSQLSHMPCIEANEELIVGLTSNVKDLDKAIDMLKYILE